VAESQERVRADCEGSRPLVRAGLKMARTATKRTDRSIGPLSLVLTFLMATIVVATAETRTRQTVKVGNTVAFELKGNPSTGYRWRLNEPKSAGLDVVRVKSIGYQSKTSGDRVVVGAPAPFEFHITCAKSGSAHLLFEYVGPTGVLSDKKHETWVRCD